MKQRRGTVRVTVEQLEDIPPPESKQGTRRAQSLARRRAERTLKGEVYRKLLEKTEKVATVGDLFDSIREAKISIINGRESLAEIG